MFFPIIEKLRDVKKILLAICVIRIFHILIKKVEATIVLLINLTFELE